MAAAFSIISSAPIWRALVGTVAAALLWQAAAYSAEFPPPAQDEAQETGRLEKAVLAGGCFWGVQGVFQHVQGVSRVMSGYAGGAAETAHYQSVGSGRSGYAESVEITFDPARISYGTLLQIFFAVAHDPTEVGRQGPDTGPQYRSAIFPTNPEQRRVAETYIAQLNGSHTFSSPIVTRIEDGGRFYPAEDYHQDFLAKHPTHPYIVVNDLPKVAQLERRFPALYRNEPVLLTDR